MWRVFVYSLRKHGNSLFYVVSGSGGHIRIENGITGWYSIVMKHDEGENSTSIIWFHFNIFSHYLPLNTTNNNRIFSKIITLFVPSWVWHRFEIFYHIGGLYVSFLLPSQFQLTEIFSKMFCFFIIILKTDENTRKISLPVGTRTHMS